MESSFKSSLLEIGVEEKVVRLLAKEGIVSRRILSIMKDHMKSLLKCDGMSIGSHALLWEMWERVATESTRSSRELN